MAKHSTEITLREVRTLIEDEVKDSKLLDAFDTVATMVLLLAPVVGGPSAVPALSLLGPKKEMVSLAKRVAKALARWKKDEDFLARHRRLAAAHCILTYAAYFEALDRLVAAVGEVPEILATDVIALPSAESASPLEPGAPEAPEKDLTKIPIRIPHPLDSTTTESEHALLYNSLTERLERLVAKAPSWSNVDAKKRRQFVEQFKTLPQAAAEIHSAMYFDLASTNEHYFIWSSLLRDREVGSLVASASASISQHWSAIEAQSEQIDLGFARLGERVVEALSDQANLSATAAGEDLSTLYRHALEAPIIDDPTSEYHEGPRLTYPSKAATFVPQAFKAVRYRSGTTHLEDENLWDARPTAEDLGLFLLQYLSSAYSTESPLLILGHPGSGKSLLTQMLAGRLAAPTFNPIRVELRDTDAEADLQSQIEDQVRKDTGREISWTTFAGSLSAHPPLVILDGYDELLQASGRVFASYLQNVAKFQRRESLLGRPVRVVVTSRLSLIDKAAIPDGTTAIRLLEFDEKRRREWTDLWNRHNAEYFETQGLRPFSVPADEKIVPLAEQPLLLLMLALYDSQGNQLHKEASINQTLLYYSLLTRFVERERRKGNGGAAFDTLDETKRRELIEGDLEKIGIAAMGMFNRRSLHISREDLDQDLRYFTEASPKDQGVGVRLTEAELVLGGFFFIHESRSRVEPSDGLERSARATAFEFLHNTFGEFLVADFLLRELLREARTIASLRELDELRSALDQRLTYVTDRWFASLVYTPLHTRPVVLRMMREWAPQRAELQGRSLESVLVELKHLGNRQLRNILNGRAIPSVMMGERPTPFPKMPVLGHVAVYTLNLVVLQAAVSRTGYLFDEEQFEFGRGECRPWDRLTAVWRSWLPLESLTGLAAILSARRRGHRVEIELRSPLGSVRSRSRLEDVFLTSEALADDIVAGLAGIHLYDTSGPPDAGLREVIAGLRSEGLDVTELLLTREARDGRTPVEALPTRVLESAFNPARGRRLDVEADQIDPMGRVPGFALDAVLHSELKLSAFGNIRECIGPANVDDEVALGYPGSDRRVALNLAIEPRWFEDFVRRIMRSVPLSGLFQSRLGISVLKAALDGPPEVGRELLGAWARAGLRELPTEALVLVTALACHVGMPSAALKAARHAVRRLESRPEAFLQELDVDDVRALGSACRITPVVGSEIGPVTQRVVTGVATERVLRMLPFDVLFELIDISGLSQEESPLVLALGPVALEAPLTRHDILLMCTVCRRKDATHLLLYVLEARFRHDRFVSRREAKDGSRRFSNVLQLLGADNDPSWVSRIAVGSLYDLLWAANALDDEDGIRVVYEAATSLGLRIDPSESSGVVQGPHR